MCNISFRIGLVVGIIFIFIGAAAAPSINANISKASLENKLLERTCGNILSYKNETELSTGGPLLPLLKIAKVDIIGGDFPSINLIKLVIRSRILHWIFPYPTFPIINYDFSIKYMEDIPSSPFFSRFAYATVIIENDNETLYTEPHTVTVKGFTGHFLLARPSPFELYPALFGFMGTCEEVMVVQDNLH